MKKIDLSFIIIFVIVTGLVISSIASAEDLVNEYETIKVEYGDTLWELAIEYKDKHDLTARQFCNWVVDKNGKNNNVIYHGESLIIPVLKK